MSEQPTITRADIDRRRNNATKNKRALRVLSDIVKQYLEGRAASSCMADLVKTAKDFQLVKTVKEAA